VSVAHVYLGWLTDHAMHSTPQNRRGCIIFWHSNALIQEVLAENGFPVNIRMNLIFPETRVIGLHFFRW